MYCSSHSPYPGNARPLLDAALPFVWLVMLPVRDGPWDLTQGFARALLAGVAVLNSLQAYPVAGSQLTWATALIILSAIVCLHDGLAGVARLLPAWMRGRWLRLALAGLTVTLLVRAEWDLVTAMRHNYRSLVRLDLPGARRLRLPEASVALYRWLALNLQAHADTFIGVPALDSLYFWSGKEPPTAVNPNAWMLLLDEPEQATIVRALAARPGAAAVRADWSTNFYGRGAPIELQPLARFINDEFQTVGRFRGYAFQVRKGRRAPELIYCARELPAVPEPANVWRAQITLPAMKNRAVHRMTVVDISSDGTLADTQPATGVPQLDVTGERVGGDQPVVLAPSGLDLTNPWRFTLQISPVPAALMRTRDQVIRLFDEHGAVFASLPVLWAAHTPASE